MGKIRVLVVDDAVVVRKILTDALGEDPDIEIAGVAANGKIALQKIAQCNPDIITLDMEMPELNGVETVRKLRETYPRLPVIMFSTLTERGAAATLEALSAGATDYVTKPANVGSVSVARERVKSDLLTKIKSLVQSGTGAGSSAVAKPPPAALAAPVRQPVAFSSLARSAANPIHVLAIGVSTGGPNALADVLPNLPKDFPVPVLIVQHMPPLFTKMLAERLDAKCNIPVQEASDGLSVLPGHVYLAAGDYHMEVRGTQGGIKLHLHQGPPENSCRPAVDPLFRSVAEIYGANTLALILTGMGQDGLRGCARIKELGGTVFVQDEKTSVVWGMPGYVAQAGLADVVLPLLSVGPELVRRVMKVAGQRELPKNIEGGA